MQRLYEIGATACGQRSASSQPNLACWLTQRENWRRPNGDRSDSWPDRVDAGPAAVRAHDIELPDDVKPANSHIALNVIEDDDGNELQILRDNMPFGTIGSQEFGTYYIAYAKDPVVTELMLRRMFLGEPAGNYDRILDFSTALTGTLFFTPSAAFLDDLPPAP